MPDVRSRSSRAPRPDLPPAVARALAEPSAPRRGAIDAGGHRWAFRAWGDQDLAPLLLVHGVTSDSGTFWRIGPALAATRRHVVAVDLPGHGLTGGWRGRHRFGETAEDLAAFIEAAGLAEGGRAGPARRLAVLGHSWGGMVTAALPAVGLRPARLILVDPPALPVAAMEALTRDPQDQPYPDVGSAFAATRAAEPLWSDEDVRAKAEALTRFDAEAVRSILVANGDWDAGLSNLPIATAAGVAVWIIRGEERSGGMIPDAFVARLEEVVGRGHVVTIANGPHSPHRVYPEATILAVLQALGD